MLNYNYAKIIDKYTLEYSPIPITVDNKEVYTTDPSFYGYKRINKTEMPVEDGYYFIPFYTQSDNAITQGWERHENEPEPSDIDRIEAQVLYTALMTDTLLEEE